MIFLDGHQGRLEEVILWLKREPCLITGLGEICAKMTFKDYLKIKDVQGALVR